MYEVILATTDFSEDSRAGVAAATRLASELGSRVVLLHVLEDTLPPTLSAETRSEAMSQHRRLASESLAAWKAAYFEKVVGDAVVVEGSPHREIVRAADEHGADLIVMSSHGHSKLGELLLGSTTDRVLRSAACPVLVVRPQMKRGARDEDL